MAYEILPADELLPYYPSHVQERFQHSGIGIGRWEDLCAADKLGVICSTTGNTPLKSYEIDNLNGFVHAKHEMDSPTGSHCDRQASVLRIMLHDRLIRPGITTIDETSSGSVASSLAIHGPLIGVRVHIRAPRTLDQNRLATMRMPGVELELTDGYIPEAARAMVSRIKELAASGWRIEKRYTWEYKAISATHPNGPEAGHIIFPNHSANPSTIEAIRPAGLEMMRQLYETNVCLDAMLLVVGNGTSVHGIAPTVRQYQPQAPIFGIEDSRNHPTYDRVHDIPEILRQYGPHDSFGSSADGTPLTYSADKIVDDIAIVTPSDRNQVRDRFNTVHEDARIGNTSAAANCQRRGGTFSNKSIHKSRSFALLPTRRACNCAT